MLGIAARDWWALLQENSFRIDLPYLPRAMQITLLSIFNSLHKKKEMRLYGETIAQLQVREPVFILGHWRNGTTLLHELLTLDERFAWPNLFEVSHPHTFLLHRETVSAQEQSVKRPMDEMTVTAESPGEDEYALATASLRSPMTAWFFTRNDAYYDRYLTFQNVPAADVARWKKELTWFLKKLTLKYQRPLLLKSPPHTGRIRLLLELFPDARFIHIHRDPYVVFQSTRRLYQTAVADVQLQRNSQAQIDEGIIRRYKIMYDAFFQQRTLIPAGRYHDIRFEEFEKNMISEMQNVYEKLNLGGFETVRPKLEQYIAAKADYQKNSHPVIEEPMRQKIVQVWQQNFREWNYEI